jgi:hypothetical protein
MIAYFVSSATGWIAVILTAVEIVLPYLLRRVSLGRAPAELPPSSYWEEFGRTTGGGTWYRFLWRMHPQ